MLATQDAAGVTHALAGAKGHIYTRDPRPLSRRTLTGRLADVLDRIADSSQS
jgi:hypothetical protein